jgi:deoxyribose-phosphate aldolase
LLVADNQYLPLTLTPFEIAQMIDLSAVRPDSDDKSVRQLVDCAEKYQVYLVSVLPSQVSLAREYLGDNYSVLVGGNVGFPSGAQTTQTKVNEARELVELGCDELDMVINLPALLSGREQEVWRDIHAVVEAADCRPVKVILECHYLIENQILRACDLAITAGAAFVKTGTGWAPTGATLENILLIKQHVGNDIGIKASGCIRDLDTLLAMFNLGARRFGISLASGRAILEKLAGLNSPLQT